MKLAWWFRLAWALALFSTAGVPLTAQHVDQAAHHTMGGPVPEEILSRSVSLRSGIGVMHQKVSTSSSEAQAFYDQGLAYLHSYVWIEAARSFNQALRIDPKLGMAHLGLTIAYVELNAAPAAREALQRARAFAVSDHDKRHVEA